MNQTPPKADVHNPEQGPLCSRDLAKATFQNSNLFSGHRIKTQAEPSKAGMTEKPQVENNLSSVPSK